MNEHVNAEIKIKNCLLVVFFATSTKIMMIDHDKLFFNAKIMISENEKLTLNFCLRCLSNGAK